MAEYIERKAAKRAACDYVELFPSEYEEIEASIDKIPAADVAPVRHGNIIETIEDGHMKRVFSCCGTDFTIMTCWMTPRYCPNCGAKMDGGENGA